MKGYKAFDPDWTCRGKQYAVGEVATQDGELELCENGIHFCTVLADCFCYYNADPGNRLAEVEAFGDILQEGRDSKCCTNKLKIVRELSITELLKDKAFCLEVVKRNPYQIRFMRDQDREVFLAAVKQDGYAMRYVPEKQKTRTVCLAAVKQKGRALKYVPEAEKTPELCLAAVQNNGWALQNVPKELRTPELCLEAVKQCSWAFVYVSEDMKTPEICLAAIEQDGQALAYVPEAMKTPELCLTAVKQDGWALEYVTDQTPEICRAAVRRNWRVLRLVKDEALYDELSASIFTD